jgi:hypothetical protein
MKGEVTPLNPPLILKGENRSRPYFNGDVGDENPDLSGQNGRN